MTPNAERGANAAANAGVNRNLSSAELASLEADCFGEPWTEGMLESALSSGSYIFAVASMPDRREEASGSDPDGRTGTTPVTGPESSSGTASPGNAAAAAHGKAGYACGVIAGDQGEIQRICVLPGFRRRGIGTRLMQELRTAFFAAGCSEIFLEVRSKNTAARSLYEKLGYVAAGVRPDYYGDDDAVIYTGLTHEKFDKGTAIMYILHTGDTNDKAIF